MTGNEIREKFLQYFGERGHELVDSSPLVPHDDPTLLFTNAGMVQFKRLFMGEEKRDYVRAATSQRCVRAGGKHNDLENVGYTARHHTFFEMLGNFSFGDYFKEDAIRYAWDFLTEVVKLDREKLWISIFEDDDEAFDLWQKVAGVEVNRIIRMGEKDNFWAMGDTGPCGPCSEIHYDQGAEAGCGAADCKLGCDCDRYLEVWNLVFMQFNRSEDGSMTPLPKPSIDTGMGLERITAVVQGKLTNYDSDLFTTIFSRIEEVTGKSYGKDRKVNAAMRVIADHSRATAFLVADGVLPSNEGRGYVLRRIMRRAIRFGRFLGMNRPFLDEITGAVVEQMQAAYPHLLEARQLLVKVVNNEEQRFLETIDNGLVMLNQELSRLKKNGESKVPGDFIFKLYDTFGFPVDIVRDIAIEKGLEVDEAGFNSAMEVQRQQSKKSWKAGSLAEQSAGLREIQAAVVRTDFVGYDRLDAESEIAGLLSSSGESARQASKGEQVSLVCPETPFYAESGGQVGDQGEIAGPNGRALVLDTIAVGGLTLHRAEIQEGTLSVGERVQLRVEASLRRQTAANHSATHLLQAALQEVLGEHVKQSGSLVNPERLRFDFTNFSPLSSEELVRVEDLVNREIRANKKVETVIQDRDEAVKAGATALFGEKYADEVRVVGIGEFSKELCGGSHVAATGEIGLMKIVSESGIAAGVRRIEAVTGAGALARFREMENQIRDIAEQLKTSPEETRSRIAKLQARQKELEKEIAQLSVSQSAGNMEQIMAGAREINGIKVVAARIQADSPKTMREMGDLVRDQLGSGVAVLGAVLGDKASLLAIVSKDLQDRFHAGNLIKELAVVVGGKGGGRPDMAQAGGSMPDKLDEALTRVEKVVAAMAE